jgi:hypothetical protein
VVNDGGSLAENSSEDTCVEFFYFEHYFEHFEMVLQFLKKITASESC